MNFVSVTCQCQAYVEERNNVMSVRDEQSKRKNERDSQWCVFLIDIHVVQVPANLISPT